MRYYGARPPSFRAAPKPANFDALTNAAATGDSDAFTREHHAYRDQCNTAGIHPGTLIGHLHEERRTLVSNAPIRTRERPLWSAYRVPGWDWNGIDFTPGDRIAYDVTVHDVHSCKQHVERHEGVIVELWVEPWWGDIEPRLYAEVDEHDGTEERVWFRRDHVSTELGFAIGAVLEGALF